MDGFELVALEFPGEIRFTPNGEVTVGDVNVSNVLKDALGGAPRLHGRLVIKFLAEPLQAKFASSTLGGKYQEPAEVK